MNCSMCNNNLEYQKFNVKEYKYWKIGLHGNQCYLSRSIVMLKRHVEDLFEITEEERNELFEIVPLLKKSINKAFKPDMMNYTSLGNEIQHLHIHIIPRYKRIIQFAGVEFKDERWGNNPSPYNKDFQVKDEVYKEIIGAIQSSL